MHEASNIETFEQTIRVRHEKPFILNLWDTQAQLSLAVFSFSHNKKIKYTEIEYR